MNNKIGTLMAFSVIGLSFAALPAFGGDLQPMHVNVPFAFTAGKTTMPAGEYTVTESDSHLVMIRGEKSAVLLLGTPGAENQDEHSALGFERTSKGILLRSIHAAGRASSLIAPGINEK